MDKAATRTLVGQLAEDLAWLEEHSRGPAERTAQTGDLLVHVAVGRDDVRLPSEH